MATTAAVDGGHMSSSSSNSMGGVVHDPKHVPEHMGALFGLAAGVVLSMRILRNGPPSLAQFIAVLVIIFLSFLFAAAVSASLYHTLLTGSAYALGLMLFQVVFIAAGKTLSIGSLSTLEFLPSNVIATEGDRRLVEGQRGGDRFEAEEIPK